MPRAANGIALLGDARNDQTAILAGLHAAFLLFHNNAVDRAGVAAFRFGHSTVRPSYRLNLTGDGGKPFFALTFDPGEDGQPEPGDLRGGVRSERRFVGWESFFDFGDGMVGPAKRIETKLSTPLFRVPLSAIPTMQPPQSLPQRDLLRQVTWQLPSGQAIAKKLGAPALLPGDLRELASFGLGLERSTPLSYYVLKKAEVVHEVLGSGPSGAASRPRC